MIIKSIAVAALLAVSASSFATTVTEPGVNKSFSFNDSFTADGSFSDSYVFSIVGSDNASLGVVSAYTQDPIGDFSVVLTSTSGYNKSFGSIDTGAQQIATGKLTGLTTGTYTLTISGMAEAGDNYGGSVSIKNVSAVPEPASVALMLAGLGCMGFIAKRRKQG